MANAVQKEFKKYGEQLRVLKDRGLDISPIMESKRILETENYYNVINGYNSLFLASKNPDIYVLGSSLNEIYALYEFDRNLRALYLKEVLEIESYIKSIIAYIFSEAYGHKDCDYLKIDNFRVPRNTEEQLKMNEFIVKLMKTIWTSRSPQPYIEFYRNSHGYVPLWVLVNSMTFGDLSKFYSYMKDAERIKLAKTLSMHFDIMHDKLGVYLKMIGDFRNLLAHDERFFEYRKRNAQGRYFRVNFNGYLNFNAMDNSVMALTVCIKLLQKDDGFNLFFDRVIGEIDVLGSSLRSIRVDEVLKKMNFIQPRYVMSNMQDIIYRMCD